MSKVLIVFGTRPEAIKMAPLVKHFKSRANIFQTKVCVTGQHREMLDQVLDFFNISSDFDLNLMKPGQNLFTLTSDIILSIKPILDEYVPDFVFVHGDTTTTMATSLACFYSGIKVCHVEAGLRTNNKYSPFPEEINRQITSRISDYHFAPTEQASSNLINEGISPKDILITGNTVIDALLHSVEKVKIKPSPKISEINEQIQNRDVILVTGHRRENHGEGLLSICNALKLIARNLPHVQIIYPVHLNPNIYKPVHSELSEIPNILLLEPMSYPDFIWLMNRSKIIITDSGGVQEEAPSLGKPVLVMRDNTERPEAVEAGTVILVGTSEEKIIKETSDLFSNIERYNRMSALSNPYGDGQASKKIVEFLEEKLNE